MLDESGAQLGIMDFESARKYAEDRDLDIVLIAPQATPPVCRANDGWIFVYLNQMESFHPQFRESDNLFFAGLRA